MTTYNEKFYENDNGVYFKSNYPSQWYESTFIIDLPNSNNKIVLIINL